MDAADVIRLVRFLRCGSDGTVRALPPREAEEAARLVLRENARRLYRL